jgi:hypothetical protein
MKQLPDYVPVVADPIAIRSYECGDLGTMEVRIERPQMKGEQDWSCRVELIGPWTRRHATMGGVDAFQALLHGIYCLRIHLEISAENKAGILSYGGQQEHFGLPSLEHDPDNLEMRRHRDGR